jgi:hypothetical protein
VPLTLLITQLFQSLDGASGPPASLRLNCPT